MSPHLASTSSRRSRRRLVVLLGNEHGRSSRRRCRGSSPPASSVLVGRSRSSPRWCNRVSMRSQARTASSRARGSRAAASSRWFGPTSRCSSRSPPAMSFGLLERGRTSTRALALEDAGGGAGAWKVDGRDTRQAPWRPGRRPTRNGVPVPLSVARVGGRAPAAQGDVDAYIELRRGSGAQANPALGSRLGVRARQHRVGTLLRPGVYRSTTAARPALVSRYRYPGDAERRRRHDDAAGPGARLPLPHREACRELRAS